MKKLVLLTAGIVTAIPAFAQQEQSPSVFSILFNATSKLVYHHPVKTLTAAALAGGYTWYKWYHTKPEISDSELFNRIKQNQELLQKNDTGQSFSRILFAIDIQNAILEDQKTILQMRIKPYHHLPGSFFLSDTVKTLTIINHQLSQKESIKKSILEAQQWLTESKTIKVKKKHKIEVDVD